MLPFFLFDGISNFMIYLMPISSLEKNSSDTIQPIEEDFHFEYPFWRQKSWQWLFVPGFFLTYQTLLLYVSRIKLSVIYTQISKKLY